MLKSYSNYERAKSKTTLEIFRIIRGYDETIRKLWMITWRYVIWLQIKCEAVKRPGLSSGEMMKLVGLPNVSNLQWRKLTRKRDYNVQTTSWKLMFLISCLLTKHEPLLMAQWMEQKVGGLAESPWTFETPTRRWWRHHTLGRYYRRNIS